MPGVCRGGSGEWTLSLFRGAWTLSLVPFAPCPLCSTAWASLMHLGEDGLLAAARDVLSCADRFSAGVRLLPQLEVVGQPDMNVVAFKARDTRQLNIYKVCVCGGGGQVRALLAGQRGALACCPSWWWWARQA